MNFLLTFVQFYDSQTSQFHSFLTVDFVFLDNICSFNSIQRGTSGYIASPGFPNSLPDSTSCIWQVIGPKDKTLYLSYKTMGLVPGNPFGGCSFDYVRHMFSTRSDKYCGCSLPAVAKGTTGKDAFLQLVSKTGSRAYHQAGFLIYFKSIGKVLYCKT